MGRAELIVTECGLVLRKGLLVMAENEFIDDELYMQRALELAAQAEQLGEIPVGALLVHEGHIIAEGFNQSIRLHDPTAHAEIAVLRAAGQQLQNYRLLNTTLYVTLEPCAMCAAALVHARVGRLVFGARDGKTGACGSVHNLVQDATANHQLQVDAGVLAEQCSQQLSDFFRRRRLEHKAKKLAEKAPSSPQDYSSTDLCGGCAGAVVLLHKIAAATTIQFKRT